MGDNSPAATDDNGGHKEQHDEQSHQQPTSPTAPPTNLPSPEDDGTATSPANASPSNPHPSTTPNPTVAAIIHRARTNALHQTGAAFGHLSLGPTITTLAAATAPPPADATWTSPYYQGRKGTTYVNSEASSAHIAALEAHFRAPLQSILPARNLTPEHALRIPCKWLESLLDLVRLRGFDSVAQLHECLEACKKARKEKARWDGLNSAVLQSLVERARCAAAVGDAAVTAVSAIAGPSAAVARRSRSCSLSEASLCGERPAKIPKIKQEEAGEEVEDDDDDDDDDDSSGGDDDSDDEDYVDDADPESSPPSPPPPPSPTLSASSPRMSERDMELGCAEWRMRAERAEGREAEMAIRLDEAEWKEWLMRNRAEDAEEKEAEREAEMRTRVEEAEKRESEMRARAESAEEREGEMKNRAEEAEERERLMRTRAESAERRLTALGWWNKARGDEESD